MLRIRDVHPGSECFRSRIRIFSIPDPRSRGQKGTGSRIRNADSKQPSAERFCLKTLFLPPGAAAAEFETRPKRKSGSLPELGLAALPPKKQRPEEEEEGDVMEVGGHEMSAEFVPDSSK